MSAIIKQARRSSMGSRELRAMPGTGYMGDPGLFGGIRKLIGGVARTIGSVAPGPGGAIARIIGGKGGKPQVQIPRSLTPGTAGFPNGRGFLPPPGRGLPRPGIGQVIKRVIPGGETGRTEHYTREEGPPGPGYHLNKSGYFLKDGTYIEPGSVWIKNRRRNPMNPRALDRAIGRIGSAKRMASKLGRITIRKAC